MSDYLVVCDRSGFVFKRSECRMTWDNKLVAIKYWEPRHPQDIIRPKSDKQSVPDARVDQPDPTSGNEMYYDLFLEYDSQCNYDGNVGFDIGMVV